MVKQASVASTLESIVGSSNVSEDTKAFSVDEVAPRAVVHPADEDEVAAVVRAANEAGLAIIPWGGGTSMRTGNVPARYDIALVLDHMADVTEHEPADLTATCRAGITVHDLEAALGTAGQIAPFDPSLARSATVGGALATNIAGASRHAFGSPRDFTIGMRVVTGDGMIVKAGGKVVKNVAGYDMCKLFIGSRGTLGVIVEATFKLTPRPEYQHRVCWLPSIEDACRVANEIFRRGISSTMVIANAAAASALGQSAHQATALYTDIGFVHGPSADRAKREYREVIDGVAVEEPTLDNPEALRESLVTTPERLQASTSVVASTIPMLAKSIGENVASAHIYAQPVSGDVKIILPDLDEGLAALPRLREQAASHGGTLVIESCPADGKQELDVFSEPPASFPLMRAVKHQFDPNNVLSPGRFVGRL